MYDFIETFIKTVENLYSLKECYEYIDEMVEKQEGFKELDLNLFKYKDIFIRTGKIFGIVNTADCIENILKYKLSTAPEFIKAIRLKNNDDMVLITRVQGSENFEFKRYLDEKNVLSEEERIKVIEDFDKLAEHNLYNPSMTEDLNYWFVLGNKIYIDKWVGLLSFESDVDKQEKRKVLLEMCDL